MAISSTKGDVSIESMTIDGGDVTCVATIDVSGAATVGNLVANTGNVELAAGNVDVAKAKGNLLMSSTAAQAITHTGAIGFDFNLISTFVNEC